MPRRLPRAAIAAAALLLLPAGCGGDERTVAITDVREKKDAGPPRRDPTTAERFRQSDHGRETFRRESAAASAGSRWQWETPAGWTQTGGGQFGREMGWAVNRAPEVTVSFSLAGGSALDNVNRWRVQQMGLGPLEPAGLAGLERRRFLERDALAVDLTGTYSAGAMSGGKKIENARMLGLIAEAGGSSAFLKIVGPAADVETERERFFALAATVREAPARADPHAGLGIPPPGGAATGGAAPPAPAPDRPKWTVPEGWTALPDRPMRAGTFRPADAKGEVVVSKLTGRAGGLFDNVKRWREQMGQAPLSEAEIAALPRVPSMGRTAVLVAIDGEYGGGMDPAAATKGARMLGAVLEGDDASWFVKYVGPADEVRREEARFRAFVESFRE